jgi:hypothetical protein
MLVKMETSGSGSSGNITATAPIKKGDVVNGLDVPSGCTEGILILSSWGNAYTSEPSPTPVGCTYELIGKVGSIYSEIFMWVWKIVPTASKITFSNISYLDTYGTATLAYNA